MKIAGYIFERIQPPFPHLQQKFVGDVRNETIRHLEAIYIHGNTTRRRDASGVA